MFLKNFVIYFKYPITRTFFNTSNLSLSLSLSLLTPLLLSFRIRFHIIISLKVIIFLYLKCVLVYLTKPSKLGHTTLIHLLNPIAKFKRTHQIWNNSYLPIPISSEKILTYTYSYCSMGVFWKPYRTIEK